MNAPGVVGDGRVVEHGDGRVQVVEPRVDEQQRHERPREDALGLGVRAQRGAEPVPREHGVTDDEEVTLSLVLVHRFRHVRQPCDVAQPGGMGDCLVGSLGMPEAGPERAVTEHERTVRGEHHVGQPSDRFQHVDPVSELDIAVAQLLPLAHREGAVDRTAGVHPRVDRVPDLEVGRRAHQVAATRWYTLRALGLRDVGGHLPSEGARDR